MNTITTSPFPNSRRVHSHPLLTSLLRFRTQNDKVRPYYECRVCLLKVAVNKKSKSPPFPPPSPDCFWCFFLSKQRQRQFNVKFWVVCTRVTSNVLRVTLKCACHLHCVKWCSVNMYTVHMYKCVPSASVTLCASNHCLSLEFYRSCTIHRQCSKQKN